MPLLRLLTLFCCLSCLPLPAFAWGEPAHAVVGELAQQQLRPGARAEVARLLASEPEPTLAGVASWADELRGSDAAFARRTGGWHYVNFRGGCEYVPARDCPEGDCVVAAINRHFLALADRKRPDAERREALKWLVHLVGDVHQPLHASPRPDKGGNDFQVAYRGKGRNLHGVWDGLIVAERARSPAAYARSLAAQPALPADPTGRSDRPAVAWALESCRLVDSLYPPRHVIDDAYLERHRPLAETRLRRAGERLASMINYALDPIVPTRP